MKSFVCVLLLAALVVAEPPRYRPVMFRMARAEAESPVGERESVNSEKQEPYAASGFKPSREFKLPSERQELAPPSTSYGTPDDSYRAPFNTYVGPQPEYGVPRSRTFEEKEGNGQEEVESESEAVEGAEKEKSEENPLKAEKKGKIEKPEKKENGETEEGKEKKVKDEKKEKENIKEGADADYDIVSTQGAYYVLLPNSQLQRVQFQTQNDVSNMAYTARLQYRNEDRAPVYIYKALPAYQPSAAYSAYGVYQW